MLWISGVLKMATESQLSSQTHHSLNLTPREWSLNQGNPMIVLHKSLCGPYPHLEASYLLEFLIAFNVAHDGL